MNVIQQTTSRYTSLSRNMPSRSSTSCMRSQHRLSALRLGAVAVSSLLFATTNIRAADAASTTAPTSEETVVLNPFEVQDTTTGRYQVSEALAGGRLRTDLFESSSNISIITGELMAD